MVKKLLEPTKTGAPNPVRVPSGASHTFVARQITLDHRYHDDDPIQEAEFTVKFPNGYEMTGKLDKQGKATLVGVPEHVEVRYGPDQREFKRADDRENPDKREQLTDADVDALFEKYRQ